MPAIISPVETVLSHITDKITGDKLLSIDGQEVSTKTTYIGIYGTTVTEQLAEEHKMPSGIYVADVDPDSPAMAAGIQIGDIICEASGEEIKDIAAYQNIVI